MRAESDPTLQGVGTGQGGRQAGVSDDCDGLTESAGESAFRIVSCVSEGIMNT